MTDQTNTVSSAPAQPGPDDIVIIGGGHAAAQLCAALAAAGAGARTQLVCAEPVLPYQRPPLSKAFLKNPDDALQPHRAEAWFAEQGISVHLGDAATRIDRSTRSVHLASGAVLRYGQLVLATGALARRLPGLDTKLSNVHVLRDAGDAQRLRAALAAAASVTVLGGGFIGLEIAATARGLGKTVQVLEAAPRLLQRAVSPELSAHVLASHQAAGTNVTLGAQITGFETDASGTQLTALSVNGQRQAVDLLVLGVGALPDTALAEAAGIACADGVLVDAHMRSSDPLVLAIGDCARFTPAAGASDHLGSAPLRLESVQNANDQAKTAAATLLGQPAPYNALPWFWSEQGTMRLQMAGLMPAEGAVRHRRPGANDGSFSIFHYLGDRLVCVESVNAPMDHLMSRKILEAGKQPTPAQVVDAAVALKTLA